MTDTTLDALLEAVRNLANGVQRIADKLSDEQCLSGNYYPLAQLMDEIGVNLDELIAQRKGRPDDQPE